MARTVLFNCPILRLKSGQLIANQNFVIVVIIIGRLIRGLLIIIIGGCYPPVDNTHLDLLTSSYPTKDEFINC